MTYNNLNHQVDSSGNAQVDFVWGNLPMQPNDIRPDVAPSATEGASNGRLSTLAASSKNIHTIALGGWNAYPAFSGNTKGAFTGTAYNYTPYIQVPEVRSLSTSNAKDALKDQGYVDANITVAAAAAGGTATISNVVVASNVATLTSNGHGFAIGDVVTVYGFTAGNVGVNGSWVITGVATNTFTFATPATATISTNAATGYAIVTASRVEPISNVAVTSNVATVTSVAHNFIVGDVITITGATTSALNVSAKTITAVSGNTFSFALTNADIASTADVTGVATAVSLATAAKRAAIASFAQNSTALTFTTATAHGFNVGDLVNLNGVTTSNINNTTVGNQAITAVPSATTFSIAKPAGYSLPATITVTAATGASGTVTYTASNTLTAGQVVSVTGLSVVVPTQTPTLNISGSITLTTSTTHGLVAGNSITIAGTAASSAGTTTLYNGTFVVLNVPSTTSVTISNGAFTSAFPITTAGTLTPGAGSGLNITGTVIAAGLTSSAFAFTNATVASSPATQTGVGTINSVVDATGQALVGAKTGTIQAQSVATNATSIALGTAITITPYN